MCVRALTMLIAPALASLLLLLQGTSPALAVGLRTALVECPSQEEMQSALRQALGEGAESAPGWVLGYDRDPSGPTPAGDTSLAITLVAPTGEHLVERRIVVGQGDCPAVAGAIAAVVERSLRAVGWTRGEPLPILASAQVAKTDAGARPSERPPRVVVGAGPSLMLASRGSDEVGANLLVQLRARIWGPLCLRLGTGLLSTSDEHQAGDVTTQMTSRFVSIAPVAALVRGRTELAAGPTAWLGVDSATSSLGGSGTRATLAVGIAASASLRLSPHWRLGLGLEGLRSALGGEYVVELDGKRTIVLPPPGWRAMATAQIELVLGQ